MSDAIIAIRSAGPDDAGVLRRLAALDSAPPLRGDVLLGIVDGEPVAAVSIRDDRATADPFVRTDDLVLLLRQRAARLRASADLGAPSPRRLRSLLPA